MVLVMISNTPAAEIERVSDEISSLNIKNQVSVEKS